MNDEQQPNGADELGINMQHLDHQVMLAMKEIACMAHASPNVRVKAASVYMRVSERYEARSRR